MQPLHSDINPFALMLDPQSVLARINHSERLERLQRRVCRPLDRPMLPGAAADPEAEADASASELAALDDEGDAVTEDQVVGAGDAGRAEVSPSATTPP